MSRRRRGLVLVGLALVLGALAAADVSRREAALDRRLAPLIPVLVARADLVPGRPIAAEEVQARELPARWAPLGAAGSPGAVVGTAPLVRIPRGAYLVASDLAAGGGGAGLVRRGERAVEVVAAGSPELVATGARVDVLVTREDAGTRLALQDVEVLGARPAPASDRDGADRVAATLRVTLRQAVYLTAAQASAREIRLLPRSAGDDRLAGPMSSP